jgi:carbamoyl-phosphate synthase large subunit
MLGKKLSDFGLERRPTPHFGVKEAVFPFNMFPEVDPVLGPEMRSTGEVLGMASSFGMAFFKSQSATQVPLPQNGSVLFTVADLDKPSALEPARLFRELGFKIYSTDGTREFLAENGIEAIPIRKLGYGRPDIVDAIKNGDIQLVINTPSGKGSQEDDSYIRKTAIKYKVSNITTTAAALAAAKGIAARRQGKGQVKSLQSYHADIR